MLLVTQDRYLFQGIKSFFPDIVLLHSTEGEIFDSDGNEYSVLVDSRAPLCLSEYLMLSTASHGKRVSGIVLEMRYREAHLLNLKWCMDMAMARTDMAAMFGLFLETKGNRLTREWFDEIRLSEQERQMLILLREGKSMEEAAEALALSVKSLYRKRIELYERLGLSNFNEACLFIFKNGLLDDPYHAPCELVAAVSG
jgi:DNA-binding CsgD family transcriptional regulator